MHYLRSLFYLLLFSTNMGSAFGQELLSDRYASAFRDILTEHNLLGTVLVFDAQQDSFYSNDFQRAAQGFLPASTFKIPNTLIALETHIVTDENSILHWDGKKRNNVRWEKDLTLKEAFRLSCVPCYQEIAGKIGLPSMLDYLTLFSYPGMDVRQETLQNFWLVGDSKISTFQQVQFLRDFYNRKIPLSDSTYQTMLKVLEIESQPTYSWSGKTGWSTDHGDNGWFVGYLRRGSALYYFAANLEPKDADHVDEFLVAREQAVRQALQAMHAFEEKHN
ncbi:penicillin-binding transpeptidase domain-containing protein [Sphingobacterium sp. lm-10]|uniref:penicillin-binding transpeptidase domain-containing protein n=1 Tax=Sphingobacterium sp. lm-10 TaxID=2944904 RepID=UPI0020210392|nr:penicillin-binding transpeptidase domain-containing protein [Sphingobacterium sp. lm-10]MCL7989177.1 penicillin-binding transpeptidase domain-containing protein [Sphingobacterium sp. lm-10]